MEKPLILVSNDDGITSEGIKSLVSVAETFGEVVVVAPDGPRSGMSQAITSINPITFHQVHSTFDLQVKSYACSGTPADCVKVGINQILNKKPDLLLSGINHGRNHSINIFYSGTLGAAFEGLFYGVPSIGFSLANSDWDADFSHTEYYVGRIIEHALKNKMPEDTILNVNIPDGPNISGIKICRQAKALIKDEVIKRETPYQQEYCWISGVVDTQESPEEFKNTDAWALENNYVSVVPTQVDMTNYGLMSSLQYELE